MRAQHLKAVESLKAEWWSGNDPSIDQIEHVKAYGDVVDNLMEATDEDYMKLKEAMNE